MALDRRVRSKAEKNLRNRIRKGKEPGYTLAKPDKPYEMQRKTLMPHDERHPSLVQMKNVKYKSQLDRYPVYRIHPKTGKKVVASYQVNWKIESTLQQLREAEKFEAEGA